MAGLRCGISLRNLATYRRSAKIVAEYRLLVEGPLTNTISCGIHEFHTNPLR
jgi:hypothetical protein